MRRLLTIAAVLLCIAAPARSQVSSYAPPLSNIQRILCSIRAANFNTTADQPCVLPPAVTVWAPTSVVVTNCSTSMTLAAGGFYPTTSKGGTPLVAATQTYATATTSSIIVSTALAAGIVTTRFTIGTVYLSLTTAQGGAASCDVYVIGIDLT